MLPGAISLPKTCLYSQPACCRPPRTNGPVATTPSITRFRRVTCSARADDADKKLSPPSTASVTSDTPSDAEANSNTSGDRYSKPLKRKADSTDWVASQLTRRFGIFGGLAWVGILTFGVVSEQIKTRLELATEEAGTKEVTSIKEVTSPSGIRYFDTVVGGGQRPQRGDLVALEYKVSVEGVKVEETRDRGKPIVLVYGSRPLPTGLCRGAEEALATMKAGGKRTVTVPPEVAFGEQGAVLRSDSGAIIPPGATVVYELNLLRVSIPPS